MQIKKLSSLPFPKIIEALLAAFSDYYVTLSEDLDYWRQRFHAARVNLDYSYGVFDQEQLVAFIIHGIDQKKAIPTAFNTGTGVLDAYRGQKLVDLLYAHALPKLHAQGIKLCSLEVIQQNARAIRVYERIGFKINTSMYSYRGKLPAPDSSIQLKEVPFTDLLQAGHKGYPNYFWDNTNAAVLQAGSTYITYGAYLPAGHLIGYFVWHAPRYHLVQVECLESDWETLFKGIAQLNPYFSINNVDRQRLDLLQFLKNKGFQNTINQYEMEMYI